MPRFIDKVRSWFGDAAPAPLPAETLDVRAQASAPAPRKALPPPLQPPPKPSSPPPAPTGQDDTALRDRLRTILSAQSRVSAGSVHLLGLDSLREKLGARWDAVSGRVAMLAERLLKDTLSPRDVFFRHETGTYVVVFAQLGSAEARLVCGRVVADLQRILLGESDTASITVQSSVRTMAGGMEMQTASLQQMLQAAAAGPPGNAATAPPDGRPAPGGTPVDRPTPLERRVSKTGAAGNHVPPGLGRHPSGAVALHRPPPL